MLFLSVIVDDFDFHSALFGPDEADSPLIGEFPSADDEFGTGQAVGCSLCAEFSTGSRFSLSPKERVIFSSVERVGLPSSDSAS